MAGPGEGAGRRDGSGEGEMEAASLRVVHVLECGAVVGRNLGVCPHG